MTKSSEASKKRQLEATNDLITQRVDYIKGHSAAQMKKNEQQATIRARNQLLSCIENFHQTCFKQN